MNRKLIAAAAAATALLPLAVYAGGDQPKTQPSDTQTPRTQAGSSFDTLDANKDGRISMPEASADPTLVETFSAADKNGDGYLDAAEYDARPKPQR